MMIGRKILVIGCPGAGKSTFARKLRDKTGLPLYYLDMLLHNSDRSAVSRGRFFPLRPGFFARLLLFSGSLLPAYRPAALILFASVNTLSS